MCGMVFGSGVCFVRISFLDMFLVLRCVFRRGDETRVPIGDSNLYFNDGTQYLFPDIFVTLFLLHGFLCTTEPVQKGKTVDPVLTAAKCKKSRRVCFCFDLCALCFDKTQA